MGQQAFDTNAVVYITAPVFSPTKNGVAYNPTGDAVDMAIVPQTQAKPGTSDWKTAAWQPSNGSGTYWVQLLVGTGTGFGQLAAGVYQVAVRVHDSPETPILYSGYISFF